MIVVVNRLEQDRPCRPHCCKVQQLFVPSEPALAGSEQRHSVPSGGSATALAANVGAL